MAGLKSYLKDQFRVKKLRLQHDSVTDFYLSSWQKDWTALYLVIVHSLLFLMCLAMLITSWVLSTNAGTIGYWIIYLTHWGVLLITITSGAATAVAVIAYRKGHIETDYKLPWYVKLYWLLYNITVPMAFMITIFYWTLLNGSEFSESQSLPDEEYAYDLTLDIFIHGINSVVVLVMVIVSRVPTHILHVYQPIFVGIVYVVFTLFYYAAGGLNALGDFRIYPMLDWSAPGGTILMVVLVALLIIFLHIFTVIISVTRDIGSSTLRHKKLDLS